MLFNSLDYLIFFPIVVIVYYLLPSKSRWVYLLLASYYFYSCIKLEYVAILIFSTLIDYIAGIRMSILTDQKKRKRWLYLSIFTNIGMLCTFKYLNFINNSLKLIFSHFNVFNDIPNFNYLWPVGISFYTFQALSYTIDVYRNKIKAERHLGIFATYVSFFPQLLAGPIEKASEMLPQYYLKHKFDIQRVFDGLKIIIFGLFKKVVIADNLAIYIGQVYNNPAGYHGYSILMVILLFPIQIYCDFSGYTDIALGSAKILGFDLTNNFRRPFFSKSVSEFWGGRWHITLSRWFREYVFSNLYTFFHRFFRFISIKTRHKIYFSLALIINLTLIAIWHGSSFTFIIAGIIIGLIVVYEQLTINIRHRFFEYSGLNKYHYIKSALQITITFSIFAFSSIFFRGKNINDSFTIINNLFIFNKDVDYSQFLAGLYEIRKVVVFILILLIVDIIEEKRSIIDFFKSKEPIIGWLFYLMLLFLIYKFGNFSNVPFYYFIF